MADHALATVDNPSSALTDFTLIVDLSDMPADWWTANNTSDGTRGRVYKGDGSTRLACDWIDFDNTNETGLLRVLWSGTLATTGTQQLWIEPPVSGNDAVAADDTYGSDNAYDSDWDAYYPDGAETDRTSNSRDGTGSGITAGDSTGQIGDATDYDSADYTDLGDSWLDGYTELSVFVWFNPDVTNDWHPMVAVWNDDWQFNIQIRGSDNVVRLAVRNDTTNDAVGDTAISDNTWSHAALSWGGTGEKDQVDGYVNNGTAMSTDARFASLGSVNKHPYIGQDESNQYDGQIQEVQIHSTARSADWIDEEYSQTNDNSTFWGTWSWESEAGGGIEIPVVHHHLIMQGGQ